GAPEARDERAADRAVDDDAIAAHEQHARRRPRVARRQIDGAAPDNPVTATFGRDPEPAHVDRLAGAFAAGCQRAGIAYIAHAVVVAVDLLGVRDARAVVGSIGDAVAVGVVDVRVRAVGPGIQIADRRDVVGVDGRAAAVEVGAVVHRG